MRIGSVNMNNYRDMMRIFSDSKRDRLNGIKERVRNESGKFDMSILSWQGTQGPLGRSMTVAEFDAARAARDPNHIKGLSTFGNDVPPARMIDLPEHMVQGIKDMARLQYAQILSGASERRMQHGDELGMLQRSFVRELPQQDRLNAMYTMNRIFQDERLRIESAVQDAIPNWQRGMRVSNEIATAILNGAGGRSFVA